MWLLILVLGLVGVLPLLAGAERPGNSAWDIDLPVDGVVVPVRVRAPTRPTAPCPVVIFSHGLGGSREGYWLLAEEWASAGFFVVQPTHAGSDTRLLADAGLLGARDAMRAAVADPAILAGRPRLVSRLIDLLPQIRAAVPAWPGTIDATRVGVGGHSFGAWTTQVLDGVRFPAAGPADLADPRPRAFLALSPNGPGALQPDAAWSSASRPLLLMIGSEDRMPAFLQRPGEDRGPQWREQAFRLLPPGDKHLAVLAGAHHCAFSHGQGARLSGEPVPEPWMTAALLHLTTTWWRATLLDDPVARAAIDGGGVIPDADRARIRWESR